MTSAAFAKTALSYVPFRRKFHISGSTQLGELGPGSEHTIVSWSVGKTGDPSDGSSLGFQKHPEKKKKKTILLILSGDNWSFQRMFNRCSMDCT